ncbi:hypothetical protein F2Q70_00038807 [Brassica cretica]|uniref:Uncharacterized protein n=2 Tax=Brassica cretica TaxID=69181 RepID=A0A8S9K2N7_BRACR|nr:hypothetical protein F2Q70_00038807 [Brassica cretica]KAF2616503.1 hypothetical protein F2Q68_00039484 [Brassica cretica]KAF3493235.1 hypothetical protein DY000_02053087 [Brassica cretica]
MGASPLRREPTLLLSKLWPLSLSGVAVIALGRISASSLYEILPHGGCQVVATP